MKKLLRIFGVLLPILLCCAGCGQSSQPASNETGAPSEVWEAVSGSFARQDSNQYDNGVLQMKYLTDSSCVMFEFRLMEGSESEATSSNLVIPGVMLVDDKDVGRYESDPDAEKPLSINFVLSEDGKQVNVTHTGETDISPDGVYIFTNSGLEVSNTSATSIIRFLPTAATSLNSNLGAYTIEYPEALVSDWFYPVQATFDDSGKVLAKFLVAQDLSAVYRADDDIDPVLIFGSAQPMLEAEKIFFPDDDASKGSEEDGVVAERLDVEQPVAWVELKNGTALSIGSSSPLIAVLPWELSYTLTAKSSDPSVVSVDENGMVKAVAVGTATISGTLSVDDGTKEFSIEVSID